MSKFYSQQLPVCKVIPPLGYGSRKSAWLSSGLMEWFTGVLSVSLLSTLLGLTWYQPVLAEVICQPVACPDSYQLKPLCDEFGLVHNPKVTAFPPAELCSDVVTGESHLANCFEGCQYPLNGPFPVLEIDEIDESCNEMGGKSVDFTGIFLDVDGLSPNIPCILSKDKSPVAKKLELIDPACSGSTCDGKFLQVKKDDQQIEKVVILDSVKDLLNAKVERSGVATDGVTQLLLRMKSEDPIIFTLNEAQETSTLSNCKWGKLMQRDGSQANCGSVTAMPEDVGGEKYVFAAYQSPLNFPLEASTGLMSAKVTIEARKKVGEKPVDQRELQLEPPPVILVHGVWDGPSTIWKNFSNSLEKERYTVYFVAHNSGEFPAAGTFDPLSTNSVAISQLITKTQEALKNLRTHEIAASQVDIVAHSMGGLIARATVKTQNYGYQYNRMDNYKKGDFHKIITIGTPHQGTRIADVLVNGKCHSKMICTPHVEQKCLSVLDKEICTPEIPKKCVSVSSTLEQILPKSLPFLGSHPLGPAVYGFQTGSTAIKNLGETPVPSHSIVAGAPTAPDEDVLEGGLNSLFDLFGLKAVGDKGNEDLRTIDDILGGDGQHDVIVPIESQRGGLTDTATTLTNQRMTHLAEPRSNEVHNRVLELLRQSPDDLSVFSHFTALQGGKSDLNFKDDQNRCQATTNTKSSLRDTASDAVISFEPQIGTMVTPGQQVKFLFDIQGGSVQKSVLFTIGDNLYIVKGAPPYTLDYTVPANTGGKINVYALTASSDPNEEAYAVESYLIVKLPEMDANATTDTVAFNSEGNVTETQAVFSGGISVDGGPFKKVIEFGDNLEHGAGAQSVTVKGIIIPDPKHDGKPADIFAFGEYTPYGDDLNDTTCPTQVANPEAVPFYVMESLPKNYVTWEGTKTPSSIPAFLYKNVMLKSGEAQEFILFEGPFDARGCLSISFGYLLQESGAVVYNHHTATIDNSIGVTVRKK